MSLQTLLALPASGVRLQRHSAPLPCSPSPTCSLAGPKQSTRTLSPLITVHPGYVITSMRCKDIHSHPAQAFLQGQMDNELGFYGRLHWRTSSSWVTKSTVQIQPNMGSQFELDNEWTGKDFVASVKLMNPSVLEGGFTGIVSGDYLQSVTPKLALGLNAHWQRPTLRDGPESLVSYCARYNAKTWIGAAQFMPGGVFKASYWRKLADKVEAAADLTLQVPPSAGPMGQGGRPEGVATIGAKYDFLVSSFRAQVDSQGRVSSLLDKRVTPGVSLQFFGEIDHYKVCWAKTMWILQLTSFRTNRSLEWRCQ